MSDVTGFLLQKVSKNGGRKVDAVARSIEHDLLSVEPRRSEIIFGGQSVNDNLVPRNIYIGNIC